MVELVPQGKALEQIVQRGYAEKYRQRGEPIHLIGVEFSKEKRSVVGFQVQSLYIKRCPISVCHNTQG